MSRVSDRVKSSGVLGGGGGTLGDRVGRGGVGVDLPAGSVWCFWRIDIGVIGYFCMGSVGELRKRDLVEELI